MWSAPKDAVITHLPCLRSHSLHLCKKQRIYTRAYSHTHTRHADSSLSTVTHGEGAGPEHCNMVSSILSLHPPDASSFALVVTTKIVSRRSQMSPRACGQNHAQLRTPNTDYLPKRSGITRIGRRRKIEGILLTGAQKLNF